MKTYLLKSVLLAACPLFLTVGCDVIAIPVSGDGVLRFDAELEGGCLSLEAEDGTTYEPQNLPDDLEQRVRGGEVVNVEFTGVLVTDSLSICQVGPILAIVNIAEVDSSVTGSGVLSFDAELEGGCFTLVADDNTTYEPQGLPEDLEQRAMDGEDINVDFTGATVDAASDCQVGTILDIATIEEIDTSVTGSGVLSFDAELEGGCFTLVADDTSYEPQGLPEDLAQRAMDGEDVNVDFTGVPSDAASICQVGTILDIATIEEIDTSVTGSGVLSFDAELEGGCFTIVADDTSYEPQGLPEDLAQRAMDGEDVNVDFTGVPSDAASICQVGTILDITTIEESE